MKNYFTDAVLYQEDSKTSKQPLPDDNDSDNEADSESEGDTPVTLVGEPIVECFNNPQCNNPSGDDDEWVINDIVTFDYPASVELLESVAIALYICPCINQAYQVHPWSVWKGPSSWSLHPKGVNHR